MGAAFLIKEGIGLVIRGNEMTMTRGDSESITISVVNEDGTKNLLEVGDTIYFTVKKNINTDEKIMQKVITHFTNNVAIIEIEPIDTDNLDFGDYVYDVQLTKSDGKVMTIITPNRFTIGGEVTYE